MRNYLKTTASYISNRVSGTRISGVTAAIFIATIYSIGAVSQFSQPVSAAPVQLNDTVFQSIKPRTNVSLLTAYPSEVASASSKHDFTQSSKLFLASQSKQTGLTPVYRLYNTKTGDFMATRWVSERESAIRDYGYQYDGISFYTVAEDTSETVPVFRYLKGALHRFAVSAQMQATLKNEGWRKEGVAFYAKPIAAVSSSGPRAPAPRAPAAPSNPPTSTSSVVDGKFTLVIFPDTQQETFAHSKDLFLNRTKKVASDKDARDIRFVGHTGDLVSAGGNKQVDRQDQYDAASAAYTAIDQSGIPYLMSIGNHDTKAVCGGGSACDPTKTRQFFRDTTVFNSYFSTSRLKLPNAQLFEAGKVDNAYKTFSAEGTNWLILTLEMSPRTAAVNWAKNVVAAHPKHNVVILSHYLLNSNSTITASNAGYGETSGRYVYDNLILKYPNVKMAFSGHVGQAGHRTDVGVNGNKVVSFLGAFHANNFNPIRYLTIDTKNNTVTSDVQAATVRAAYLQKYPTTKLPDYNNYDAVFTGMNFVK
ncbi:MAG: metallophosphoesterase [Candidatus Saccharibacteria bacterium]|nr:metallophosphoesterase [Candidatus Saccharibacteria bacterium]